MKNKFNDNEIICNSKSGIYVIINIITSKIYIGSAVNLSHRRHTHLSALKLKKHKNRYLQSSYNKYGEHCFIFKVIEYVDNKESLINREQFWINQFDFKKELYNLSPTAKNCLGVKRSNETKLKLSIAAKNMSLEHRKKISLVNKGRKCSDKMKQYLIDKSVKKPVIQIERNSYEIVNIFKSLMEAERHTGFGSANISSVCSGLKPTYKNYLWRYLED